MKIPLSDRLLRCADCISDGIRVADIGCDHGYLGIYLLSTGRAKSVIAADVKEGPLQSAMRNALKFGVGQNMRFYLSDGARNIPRDFDAMVCAGMGGDTIIHILEDAPWLKNAQYRLILQCQSKTPMLRKYLSDKGWFIAGESILQDGRFLYTVMDVYYQPDAPRLTLGQCYISPAMADEPLLPTYRQRIIDGLRLAVTHQNNPEKKQALAELEQEASQ